MENTLEAKHTEIILRHAKTPGNSAVPTPDGGNLDERVASINKYTRNKRKLWMWVTHTDCTTRTNGLPTPHRQQSGSGE